MKYWYEEFPDIFSDSDIVEKKHCILCGGDELESFTPPKEWSDVSWKRCYCGFMQQTPRPTEESIARFYQSTYRDEVTDEEYPMPKDIGVQMMRAQRQWAHYGQARPPRPKAVIDIGCANGILLEHAQLYFGSRVFGVELNERDHELLDDKNIPWGVDISEAPGKFDLVLMSHVIEHMDDPVAYLNRVRQEIAAPKCHLLIEIPTPKTNSAYSKFHYTVFTQEALFRTLTLSGWIPKLYTEHGGSGNLQTLIGRLPK